MHVSVKIADLRVTLTVTKEGLASAHMHDANGGFGKEADSLSDTERVVLEALAESGQPMTVEEIAERAGRPCNSHFREMATGWYKQGKILKSIGGFIARK